MEDSVKDVVIVGAGLAGLAAALGLHRKGIKILVVESSESLRSSGYAFTTWTNAWKALDALGIGDSLRSRHFRLDRALASSAGTGATTSELPLTTRGKCGEHEIRCVRRKLLLETLEKELPEGTIRYSCKVVSIDEEGSLKLLHLADGSMLKTKILVGCDGVNSVVAKWLGLKKPSFSGRSAARGIADLPNGHGFNHDFVQYFGVGFRIGFLPCDERTIYWFFTWTPSAEDEEVEHDEVKMKQFVLSKMRLAKVPEEIGLIIEKSEISEMGSPVSAALRFRWPFYLVWGDISKGNVCVAGDALHPMTPDLGQGACAALEDGVVLARCLGDALSNGGGAGGEYQRIKKSLEKYAKERRWRGIQLISVAYLLGTIQQSNGVVLNFLRDKCLSEFMANMYLKMADFDCGKLGSN